MALINGHQLIELLEEKGQVGGAFNTTNLETTVGILKAVEETGIPAFIQVAPTNVTFSGYEYIFDMVSRYAKTMKTPVALHLDHGKTFESVKLAIDAGFTSVMIDGAAYNFDENITFTKRAVDYAKPFGIPVEAELGAIGGKEDEPVSESALKTDPNQVEEFVERTGCDLLAVSIGNVHGLDDIPVIDMPLLKEVSERSPIPLVIHGGSGIEDSFMRQFKNHNVVKINIASDLRNAYIRTFGEAYNKNNNEASLIKVSEKAVEAVYQVVKKNIYLINNL